jgi:hypothetical protein
VIVESDSQIHELNRDKLLFNVKSQCEVNDSLAPHPAVDGEPHPV